MYRFFSHIQQNLYLETLYTDQVKKGTICIINAQIKRRTISTSRIVVSTEKSMLTEKQTREITHLNVWLINYRLHVTTATSLEANVSNESEKY